MSSAFALTYGTSHFEISPQNKTRHAQDLRSSVRQALQRGDRHFVFDCGPWGQLDLATLSSLIQCASACREHGASFEVANMSSELRAEVRALRLTNRLGLTE